jgi:hypothetical protein
MLRTKENQADLSCKLAGKGIRNSFSGRQKEKRPSFHDGSEHVMMEVLLSSVQPVSKSCHP